MSGHRPFAELTKDFTPERWRRVHDVHAELDIALSFYESPGERERRWKTCVSSVPLYRSGKTTSVPKMQPRPPVFVRSNQWTEPEKKPISLKDSNLMNNVEKLISHPLQSGTELRFRRLYRQSSNSRRGPRPRKLIGVR
jgi:hypothetical protein